MKLRREGHELEAADAARQFLTGSWSTAALREWAVSPEPLPLGLWKQASELGWMDLLSPEEAGGLGLGPVATGAVLEESGRALFPGPLMETIVGLDALRASSHEHLPTSITLALAEMGSDGLPRSTTRYDGTGLTGCKTHVPFADVAGAMLTVASHDSRHVLLLVDPADAHVEVEQSIDVLHRPCVVTFDGTPGTLIAAGDEADALLARISVLSTIFVASRLLGVAERMLELGVDYARVREQFGRPIGSFQAIRHRLAEDCMMITAGRSATYVAQARAAADVSSAARDAVVAKTYLSQAGRRIAEDILQVHGGIGFTVEHDLHLFMHHALTLQGQWGSEHTHLVGLGSGLVTRGGPASTTRQL